MQCSNEEKDTETNKPLNNVYYSIVVEVNLITKNKRSFNSVKLFALSRNDPIGLIGVSTYANHSIGLILVTLL